MNCPICDYKDLGKDLQSCPSCNTDLTVFRALDDVEISMQKQKKFTLLFIILFFLAFMACFAIYFILCTSADDLDAEKKITTYEAEIQAITTENQQLRENTSSLKEEIAKLRVENEELSALKQITHVIKEGETLYTIARIYLGNGDLYPKIANDNGIEDPDIIITGTELIINK